MHLQHFLSWNKANIKYSCKPQLYNFIIDYGLIHTYTHTQYTSLMFNEHLFQLCDCTCLNVMCVCLIGWWSNPKRFLSILFVSGSDFCHFDVEIFFSKCQILCVEKICLLSFHDYFREWFQVMRFLRNSKLKNSNLTNKILPCASTHFASRHAIGSWVTNSWNVGKRQL